MDGSKAEPVRPRGRPRKGSRPGGHVDLLPANPFRPLDWRWRRAGEALEGRPPLSRRDDRQVRAATALRRKLLVDPVPDARLPARLRDYCQAWRLHEARTDPSWEAYMAELQARLLSGADDDAIGDRLRLAPGAVAAYEALFFPVRGKPTGWIVHHAIGSSMHTGLRPDDYATLWRWCGHFGGPVALDFVIDTVVGPTRPRNAGELAAAMRESVRNDLARKAMIAAKTASLNDLTQREMLALFAVLTDRRDVRDPAAGERLRAGVEQAISEALDGGRLALQAGEDSGNSEALMMVGGSLE